MNKSKCLFCVVIMLFLTIQAVSQIDETGGEVGGTSSSKSGGNVFPEEGNVGIGVFVPTYKLEVNGIVRSKEMLVESHPWPDFVFESDYDLPDLPEVEQYISENGHLEHIPSASTVDKNGIAVGDISAKLLQKIEELTLYLIEQNKQIKALEKEVELLKKTQSPIDR